MTSRRVPMRAGTLMRAVVMLTGLGSTPSFAGHEFGGAIDRRPPPPDFSGGWVWIDPAYENRSRTIREPAVFETRLERVWVEPVYREERVAIPAAAVYADRARRVWRDADADFRGGPGFGRHGRPGGFNGRSPAAISPGRWETVNERVCISPATVRYECRQVCVTPGHWTTVERQVCVKPACERVVCEPVCVRPGHWERRATCAPGGVGFGFEVRAGGRHGR